MVYVTERRHPRWKDSKGRLKKFTLCGTNLGCHICSKERRKSDFKEYGIGIVLYFKMLKYITILFLALSVMSVPIFTIYASGAEKTSELTT
jgi:hypothetical protein